MSQKDKPWILYFVKYPEPGKVKTRLAKDVGNEKAAQLYDELARKNFEILLNQKQEGRCVAVVYDPPSKEAEIKLWLSGASLYFAQEGVGLGERLANAFEVAFKGGASGVAVIGSDTLDFAESLVEEAFEALEDQDVVIGPAKDGGYYLFATNSLSSNFFKEIDWSTEKVLQQTLQQVKKVEKTYLLLAELEDLDDVQAVRG